MNNNDRRELGLSLILLTLTAAVLVYGPIFYKRYTFKPASDVVQEEAKPGISAVSEDFGLVIPILSINVPIIGDLNSIDKNIYERALSESGAGHMQGTKKPNEEGNTVVFGHSSSLVSGPYASLFVNLDKLKSGDLIYLSYRGDLYEYKVESINSINKEEVSVVQSNGRKELTIFTCWPPGTDLQRLVVKGKISKIIYRQ